MAVRRNWGWATVRDFATWTLSWALAGIIAWTALKRTGSIDAPTGGLVAFLLGGPFWLTREGTKK